MDIPTGLLVVSDFHMTSGRDPRTGRYSATEDFFWDQEFADFLDYFSKQRKWTLVFNGDLFDFIQVLVFPTDAERSTFGIEEKDINRTYGLRSTSGVTVFQVNKVIDGHSKFFDALVSFVLKGNHVKILKGNHDVQLFWSDVQNRMYKRLEDKCSDAERHLVRERLEFLPWCYHIPDLIYVEHGNQYEDTCSSRHFLYPALPFKYRGTEQIELELSSFLVRYWTNGVETVNPLADNIRPTSKFVSWFWKNHPLHFIVTAGSGLRYVLKAFSKARALTKRGAIAGLREVEEKNRALIREQAERFAKDKEESSVGELERKLLKIYSFMKEPVLPKGAWNFLKMVLRPARDFLLWILPLLLIGYLGKILTLLARVVGPSLASQFTDLSSFIDRHPILHILVLIAVGILLIRLRTSRKISKEPQGHVLSGVSTQMRGIADRIRETLNVKYVTFGHTHYSDIHRLASDGWYFNTGCWITVFAEKEKLYRAAQQFTFLKLENGDAELLHWEPSKREPATVVVMDTETPLAKEEGIFRVLWNLIRGLVSR